MTHSARHQGNAFYWALDYPLSTIVLLNSMSLVGAIVSRTTFLDAR